MKKINRKKLAAIDVGTNSIHLVVVEFAGGGRKFKVLDREKESVRLGGGGMKRLSEAAMKRGLRAIKMFSALAELERARVRAVATSAVREASNRRVFINKVKKETGVKIETISGKEEARLIYLGVLSSMPVFNKKIMLVDIGGGSTEILVGLRGEVLYSASLKMGAVRMTGKYFKTGKTTDGSVKACRTQIERLLSIVPEVVKGTAVDAVIGTSGTILNLAKMIRADKALHHKKNGKGFFTKDELYALTDKILSAKDAHAREALPGLDPARADIITSGALILREVFKKLKIKNMATCKTALREGIVLDTMARS